MFNAPSLTRLVSLALTCDASSVAAKSDAAALTDATRQTFAVIYSHLVETVALGATLETTMGIIRNELDRQMMDMLMSHMGRISDVQAIAPLIRKGQKLASRLMGCAYALFHGADSDAKINDLEKFAAMVRRGFYVRGRLESIEVAPEMSESEKHIKMLEGRLAALLDANDTLDAQRYKALTLADDAVRQRDTALSALAAQAAQAAPAAPAKRRKA